MRSLLMMVPILAACSQSQSDDVVGPFTGSTTRFVVDGFHLPTNSTEARSLGDDLDGDGVIDNELGMVMGTLTTFGDRTTGTASMIASGALASTVLIQADDLTTDDAVAVTYLGADGAPAKAVGGTFAAGRFVSNRTRDSHESAEAEVHLAVLDAADPTILHVRAVEITLTPDGRGGYDGLFRGVADPAEATDAAATGVQQMLTASPHDHAGFASAMDRDADGTVTIPEIESAPIFVSLLAPDLKMFVGTELSPQPKSSVPDSLSLGFGFHLSPCPAGSCVTTAPADRCNDRVLDGDETDIDCGGLCGTCGAGAPCHAASDCDSGSCDGGRCRAPTCSDGHLDGFESDIDCGSLCASKCTTGQRCNVGGDCASNGCGSNGRCH